MRVWTTEKTAMYDGSFVSRSSRSARNNAAGTINMTGYIFSYAARPMNRHISNLFPVHKPPTHMTVCSTKTTDIYLLLLSAACQGRRCRCHESPPCRSVLRASLCRRQAKIQWTQVGLHRSEPRLSGKDQLSAHNNPPTMYCTKLQNVHTVKRYLVNWNEQNSGSLPATEVPAYISLQQSALKRAVHFGELPIITKQYKISGRKIGS